MVGVHTTARLSTFSILFWISWEPTLDLHFLGCLLVLLDGIRGDLRCQSTPFSFIGEVYSSDSWIFLDLTALVLSSYIFWIVVWGSISMGSDISVLFATSWIYLGVIRELTAYFPFIECHWILFVVRLRGLAYLHLPFLISIYHSHFLGYTRPRQSHSCSPSWDFLVSLLDSARSSFFLVTTFA